MFWGVLRLCHVGVKAGAVVRTNQGCPGVYHFVTALVGQLGLVWAKGPGTTEAPSQLRCPDCALVCAFKVEGECRPCP